ncbi:MAG: hypothetical protein WBE20_11600, partial [Candidatus Acidiferrales bacterium]
MPPKRVKIRPFFVPQIQQVEAWLSHCSVLIFVYFLNAFRFGMDRAPSGRRPNVPRKLASAATNHCSVTAKRRLFNSLLRAFAIAKSAKSFSLA